MAAMVGTLMIDIQANLERLSKDMTKGQATVSKSLDSITAMAKKAGVAFAAYLGVNALKGLVMGSAQGSAQLEVLSQRLGVSVESLSSLQYAAEQTGASSENLGRALRNLGERATGAARGNQEIADSYHAFGISMKDASGDARAADAVLADVADVLSKMPEGANRTAAAMKLLGVNSGPRLLPMLKDGREGLAKWRAEADAVNATTSTQTARSAERFLKNLKRMKAMTDGVTAALMDALLPALEGITEWLSNAGLNAANYGMLTDGLSATLDVLASALDALTMYFGMLLEPIRESLPSWEELRRSWDAITAQAEESGLVLRSFGAALKYARTVGLALALVFRDLGRRIGGAAAAIVELISGNFKEAWQIAKDVNSDSAEDAAATWGSIKETWSKGSKEILEEGKKYHPGLREGLERMREAGARAAAETRAGVVPALKQTSKAAADAAKKAKELAAALRDMVFSTRELEAQLTDDKIEQVRIRLEREIDALKELAVKGPAFAAEAERQRVALTRIAEQEIAGIRADAERTRMDVTWETESIYARMQDSRIIDIQRGLEREIEMVRRAEEDKLLTAEQAKSRRIALEREAREAIRVEQQKATEDATLTGISIADSIANGMREGFKAKNWKDIFKSLLGMISRVASFIPGGGSVVSAGASFFSGFFAKGGEINGPGTGTSDSILARVSNGEFVNQAASVRRFGVPFFERLNQGILDLSALPAFATGGLVGATAGGGSMAAMPSSGSSRTEINVSAFDPLSMLEVIGQVVEPAAYRRGSNRSGAKHTSGLRRQVAAPRHGRQA